MLKSEDIEVSQVGYSTGGMRVGMNTGVKLTHKPTGITVTVSSERSQHRNRELALQKLEKMVAETQTTGAADSQPAPEYVGNGMFKGETIEKAAEHWANWCDRRCMTGLSEFLRVVAARAPADSVLEDAARWQWLADYLIGDRTDLDEGIVACATIDALRQFADAARKQGAN